ncbi:cupin domain-containing protein (plasmid) [Microvirga terrae]|uniref:Cupin domain-containing protein n=1 Tax=Microvirga terrae TaxID=2740529 RepID=A0ABY5S2C4_9HYPH|nr:cupin domain-containing protein [Microvirga terrae]UVF22207.1 cupin domain-containing protein [Microvirga terrae]
MPNSTSKNLVAHFVNPLDAETLDVMGPQIQLLVEPGADHAPSVMRGTIPPGTVVPLHSHDDPETFIGLSGEAEGLIHSADEFRWVRIQAGDIFHVPGGAKHAFRNRNDTPYVALVVSTSRMAEFFRVVGTPLTLGERAAAISEVQVQEFFEAAARFGYWTGGQGDNAAIGLDLRQK